MAACGVSLLTQRSRTECRLGATFGCAACIDERPCGPAMYVEGGCRGVFKCNGREVPCGQAGDIVGTGRRRCECWFDGSPAGTNFVINMSSGGVPKQAVFNAAYSWSATTRSWWGLARYMQGAGHLAQCWRRPMNARLENHSRFIAVSNEALHAHGESAYRRLAMPANARCDTVGPGEPKWILESAVATQLLGRPSGGRSVYCYTNGRCPEGDALMSRELPAGRRRDLFLASQFGNFVFAPPENDDASDVEQLQAAVLLSYTTPPDSSDPSAKNFLFFSSGGALHVLALIEPHTVYTIGLLRGHATVAHMAMAHVTPTPFGFGSHLRLSLSGGPVRVDEQTFLVAGHVATGGWWSAQRLTFFYAFEATPPFAPRCATPPMGFGLSRDVPPLEYATHLELHDRQLYVSVGVGNCWTALVQIPLAAVMARCRALPLNSI